MLSLNLQKLTVGNVQYTIPFSIANRITRAEQYNQRKYFAQRFHLIWAASYLTSKSDSTNTRFLRPSFDISQAIKIFKGITVGIHGEEEHNRIFLFER